MAQADGPGRPRLACALPGAAPGLAYALTFLAFLVHNISELVEGLPGWAAARGVPVTQGQYANAIAILTLAAGVLLLIGRAVPFARPLQILTAVLTGALLANVVSHAVGSLVTATAMPGLWTALALVLPSAAWLLLRPPLTARDKTLSGLAGALAMPLFAGAALLIAA
ncbi:MAG: HXXEE domain-containing protein [Maritimibacter sp.]|nr:HXXEE domain-containing protein [Maritimibacter sp.]